MAQEAEVLWTGRPWIGPALALRTVGVIILAVILSYLLVLAGFFYTPIGVFPLFLLLYGLLGLVWILMLIGLFVKRASYRYVLRRTTLEVDEGIARRKQLVVSPTGFSELEVDQGIVGRMLNYGSIEVRSQGSQQLNLSLIRNPKDVAAKIRDVMSTPTVRIAKD